MTIYTIAYYVVQHKGHNESILVSFSKVTKLSLSLHPVRKKIIYHYTTTTSETVTTTTSTTTTTTTTTTRTTSY